MSLPPRSPSRANRRQHARLEVDAPARLLHGASVVEGRLENLSALGAAFLTPDLEPELAAGTAVILAAPGADGADAALEVPSCVVRSEVLLGAAGEERSYALRFDLPIDVVP